MKHIAVVGAGISGLAAAYVLSRAHRVSLFEADARLGGHTHTIVVDDPSGPIPLDTGFLVHNRQTYPNLVRLFREIGVATRPSDMSFSVACPATGFAYSSRGVRGFFAQRRRALSAAHLGLLRDIVRFNRRAPDVLDGAATDETTLGEYLAGERYGDAFVRRYLVPMTSAIWSTSFDGIHRFPVRTLVRFLSNHGMLSVGAHPRWRVVEGGSHAYVPKLTAPVTGGVHTGVRLRAVRRDADGVTLDFFDRPPARADEVVFACPGDRVLPLLADPSDRERDVLGAFTSTRNDVWLHRDRRFLPSLPWARASWNYRLGSAPEAPPTVTYHLNRLQGFRSDVEYCVTLNPQAPIAPDAVIRRLEYRHPRLSVDAVRAQGRWHEISGVRRTHFCGAYWRYGFHEDGLVSALRVARALGVAW